jgi:putative adenylate-forming enzyme
MNFAIANAAIAFWRTKRLAQRLRTRRDVERWRDGELRRFLRRTVPEVPFYREVAAASLEELPVIDKEILLANFDRLNTAGVTFEEAREALDHGQERVRGLIVGQSTGTSGNRGVFLISEAERFTWLGVMLAKTLPDFPFGRHKVALALPGYSQLYASAAETGRLAIRFFDLALGVEAWRDALTSFAPDTIVAPPKVLRALAEGGGIQPRNIFSGAEVLDPTDREIIERGFSGRVREIYMATEGLFGVACPHGVLHLAEDVVAFEWRPALGSTTLMTPLITDFTRRTQVMARYRMNDLLSLSVTPCACGSPLQAVAAVEGRQDDVFELTGREGAPPVKVTPDVMRNAVIDADRRILDYRVVQVDRDVVVLSLAPGLAPEAGAAAVSGLKAALAKAGAGAIDIRLEAGLSIPMDRKLRRVRRDWKPDGPTITA